MNLFGILLISAILSWFVWASWTTNGDTEALRAACKAKGGALVLARDATYVCVPTIDMKVKEDPK